MLLQRLGEDVAARAVGDEVEVRGAGRVGDRLKRRAIHENRADDANEAVIRRRFEVYQTESRPVLEHYSPEIISQIDSLTIPVEVTRNILNCLLPVIKHASATGAPEACK